MLGEDVLLKSGTAGLGVVGKDVDAVAGADGDETLELPFGLGFEVLQKGEFAAEDLDEEVAVAAGGFEEAAVEPEGLIAHEVEWRLLICFVFSLLGIKKSWNFSYAYLGVPRPAKQVSKAHDYS